MYKSILIVFLLIAHYSLNGQTVKNNRECVEIVFPFPTQNVILKPSWIRGREELNCTFLKSLDPDRLLHNFRITAGLPSQAIPLEGWEAPQVGLRGHFTGHYLSAVSHLVRKYKDPQLSKHLIYMIEELDKCRQASANGYLGAFPQEDFDVLETRFTGVWAPYYTYHKIMQGLWDTYVYTHNTQAYDIVLSMAEYVQNRMAKLNKETIEKMMYTAEANPQNEMGAMNEVLYKLYRLSDNSRHFSLAETFDQDWFLNPLSKNEDILSGLHSNTHIVLVNGFVQRYSITQESKYHDAAINFWNMLMNSHAYANGSSSGPRPNVVTPTSATAEHWGEPGILSNTFTKEIAESCVTHNTQKLTSSLFEWTADPKYADSYMNTFYNAVLPTQNENTGCYVYHLPLGSPRQKKYLKENDFFCCNGSSVEAFTQFNSGIYYHNDSALWVNLYIPSEVNWDDKEIRVEQQGEFPKGTDVNFIVSARRESEFVLKLYIPTGTKSCTVFVNNERYASCTTSESYLNIKRKWHNKDEVKLVFEYNFHLKPTADNSNVFAIYYGPMMLAFEEKEEIILKGDQELILNNLSVIGEEANRFNLHNNGKNYLLRPFFEIESQDYGVYSTIRNY